MISLPTKISGHLDKFRHETVWDRVFIVLLFSSLALLVFFRVQDYDFFWHIANGKIMVEQGRIVNEEIFSFTRPGIPFSNHEWLAQVVFYLIFENIGAFGIVLFKTLLVLLLALLLYRTARFSGGDPLLSALLVILVIFMGIERYRERPEIFSLLFIGLMGYILFGYTAERVSKASLYAIPCILVLWDFLHGAIYGIIFLIFFLIGETLKHFFQRGYGPFQITATKKDSGRLRALWTIALMSLAAVLINPYGLRSYDIFLEFLHGSRLVERTLEFAPPDFKLYSTFWMFFILVAGLLLANARRTDLTRILIIIPFAILTLRYRRVIPFFGLVTLPALATVISQITEKNFLAKWYRPLARIIGCGLVIYIILLKFVLSDNPYSFGYEVNSRLLPVGTARYLAESELTGNMYNPGHFGGYLAFYLYPERKIFQYNHHVVFGDFPSIITNSSLLEKFAIEYAVLERYWGDSPFYGKVFTPDKWFPVFWDDASIIVVKKSPENESFIERNGLRIFTPQIMEALGNYSSNPKMLEKYESNPEVMLLLAKELSACIRFYKNRLLADYLGYLTLKLQGTISNAIAIEYIRSALVYNDSSAYLWLADSIFHDRAGDFSRAQQSLARSTSLDPALVAQFTGQLAR
jgi:hypothetical protein